MEQVQPDHIIMSTKAQDKLIEKVRDFCKSTLGSGFEIRFLTTDSLAGEDRPTDSSLQPFRTFQTSSATYSLASVRLPSRNPIVTRAEEESTLASGQDEMTGTLEYVEENGAGMGKMRLSLVKLGCYVNVDAPSAVSQLLGTD